MALKLGKKTAELKNCWQLISDNDNLGFDFFIRYSQRKTAEIRIQQGEVKVYAPLRMPMIEIYQWLESKKYWVQKSLSSQQKLLANTAKTYAQNEAWPYLGQSLSLNIYKAVKRPFIYREGDKLSVGLSVRSQKSATQQVKQLLQQWYQQQAKLVLTDKTYQLAQSVNMTVSAVKLRRTKTKWGHCTTAGVIQYNWLIMQAPEPVVDYLVAHEVCHLRYHNHSKAYWSWLGKVYPNYREMEQWLKHNGHLLTL